jgi:tRNA-dihydrouridine synthase
MTQQFFIANNPSFLLAPMEGITGHQFRKCLAELNSVDIVATEFVRITTDKQKLPPFDSYRCPLQVQLMASSPTMLRDVIKHLKQQGVLNDESWIDLNVGCPSKRVNASGAGAKLLCDPEQLYSYTSAMREVHSGMLSLKTRVGYQSAEDFPRIVGVLAKCPLDFVTIHARTKADGYERPVNYEHLSYAAANLPFPVIGNGEIWTAQQALEVLNNTRVHGIMCGRSAVADPYLFCEAKQLLGISSRPLPYKTDAEKRIKLYEFAIALCKEYEHSAALSQKRDYVGTFKEYSIWFGKNPLIDSQFFQSIKRLQTLAEIREVLETQMMHHTGSNYSDH